MAEALPHIFGLGDESSAVRPTFLQNRKRHRIRATLPSNLGTSAPNGGHVAGFSLPATCPQSPRYRRTWLKETTSWQQIYQCNSTWRWVELYFFFAHSQDYHDMTRTCLWIFTSTTLLSEARYDVEWPMQNEGCYVSWRSYTDGEVLP